MYRVEFYAEVRRCVYVEGLSERAAARRFGLARQERGTRARVGYLTNPPRRVGISTRVSF